MAFEDSAFRQLGRAERWLRGIPTNVQLRPTLLDRQVFRMFVATMSALALVLAIPSRTWRIRALLLLGLLVMIALATFALLDAFSHRRR